MKRALLFFLLVAFAGCLTAYPQKKEAPERQGWPSNELGPLYGDVESVTITDCNLSDKFGVIVKGEMKQKLVSKLNLKGDVVELRIYRRDGSLRWNDLYKYDSQGNMIEKDNSDGKYLYKYDSQGNIIEGAEYKGDGSLSGKRLYKYDSQGNMIEEACYNSDGSLDHKYLYKYDLQGNMIEKATYYSDGKLGNKETWKYDSQGNKIEEAEYNSNGSLRGKTLYKYDSQGNMIEIDNSDRKYLYKYDSQGNIIEEAEYKGDGSLSGKRLYKYDSQSNWIEKIRYKSEIMIPEYMMERTIVYRK